MKPRGLGSLPHLALLFAGLAQTTFAQQMPIPPKETPEAKGKNNASHTYSIYDIWLAQDVKWIITDPELRAFNSLTRDEERQNFVEQFWSQRDPTPDTVRNEFKDSHYQRMLKARQKFSTSGVMGWDTAKGRVYVMYGAPDKIEQMTGSAASGLQSAILGSQCTAGKTIPVNSYEVWYYNHIRRIDHPVAVAFSEQCKSGEFLALVDKKDADWLNRPPIPKYKLLCNGKVDPNDESYFRLRSFVCGEVPPRIQFKDLEEIVTSRVTYNLLRFEVQLNFDPITDASDMVQLSIKVKNSDLACGRNDCFQRAPARIFGRFTTTTGRVAHDLEDTIDVATDPFSGYQTYTQSIPLLFGRYRLNLVLQDVNGDRIGTYAENIDVPDMRETAFQENGSKNGIAEELTFSRFSAH